MGEAAKILEPTNSLSAKTLGPIFPEPGLDHPEATAEVGEMPARWLFSLPQAVELSLHVPGVAGVVRVNLDGESTDDDTDGSVWLDGDEWIALVVGVEADRVWDLDLRGWLERKRTDPAFRLCPELTLAGAQPDPEESWTVARVLDRVGASLLGVGI